MVWSPSRIVGNFLIYRELDKKPSTLQKQHQQQQIRKRSTSSNSDTTTTSPTKIRQIVEHNNKYRTSRLLVGSLSEAYNFKEHGLIKKTMSLVVNGAPFHLVSYYHPDDVLEHQLRTPSVVPELANLDISPELLSKQNFRILPMIEPDNNTSSNVPTPTQSIPNTPISNYSTTSSISTPLKNTSIHALLSNHHHHHYHHHHQQQQQQEQQQYHFHHIQGINIPTLNDSEQQQQHQQSFFIQ